MTKPQKSKGSSRPARRAREDVLIPPRYQHLAAGILLVVSLVVFFHQIIFEDKTFVAADTIAAHSYDTFLADADSAGIFPLWNPYIFCGMPAYGSLTITGDRWFDFSNTVFSSFLRAGSALLLNPSSGWVLVLYIVFAIGMYWFSYTKLEHKVAALATALAATYSMYIIIWIMSGHNTKIAVMAMFPYILLAIDRLRGRFSWGVALALVLALHFAFVASHIQMIFYIYLAVGVYLLFSLIREIAKKGEWKPVLRTGIVFALATALAFAMDSDRYLSTLEYNPHSIRGANPITETVSQAAPSKSVEGGLDYDYATSWSFAPGEMLTFVIPSAYGFGSVPYSGVLSGNREIRINTYFGPQPFTEAPQYMGVVVLVLAFIGFVQHRRNPFVQYLGGMILLSLFIAFGRELSFIYDLMYNYFPAFNKFRVPSMILVLVQIMVPMLAGYGVLTLFGLRDHSLPQKSDTRWKAVLGGLALLLLVSLVASSVIITIYQMFMPQQEAVNFFAQRYGNMQVANELYRFVTELVVGDARMAFLMLLVAGAAMYFYAKQKLSFTVATGLLLLAIVADLWRVDARPMEPQAQRGLEQQFTAPPYVQFLLQDTSQFRVLELIDGQPPTSNTLAYWRIQSAFGYHGAKLRAYQDVAEVVGLTNPLLWQLMNVKYIITNTPDSSSGLRLVFTGGERFVYLNENAERRAFFVDSIAVAGGLTILQNIRNQRFQASEVAYLMNDPGWIVDPPKPGAEATVAEYGSQRFSVHLRATGNNLLFLSETYYPEGWVARLDGNEVPIARANYLFRAVLIPPGEHTLTMSFEPRGFAVGKNLSLGANILVLSGLILVGVHTVRRKKTEAKDHQPTTSSQAS